MVEYVDEFKFPADRGFTGSAGQQPVKGYMRGGYVKKTGTANAMKGGHMKYDDPGPLPKNVKAHGGKMSTHDKLVYEGGKMGYAYGGKVTESDTSGEFVQTRGKQATMDNANYPPGYAGNQRDKESGPRKKLRPRFKHGGVHHVRDVGAMKGGYMKSGMGNYSEYAGSRRKASKKGMPKNVKSHGGLARYAKTMK